MAITYTPEGPKVAGGFTGDNSGVRFLIANPGAGQPPPSPVAIVTLTSGQISEILSSSPLGFAVPAGRRITGIRVELKNRLVSSDIADPTSWSMYVTLRKNGVDVASTSGTFEGAIAAPASGVGYQDYVFGGETQELGLSVANSADGTTANGTFTVHVQFDATFGSSGTGRIDVDSIEVIVYHVPISLPYYACSDPAIGSDGYSRGQALNPLTPWKTLAKFVANRFNGDKLEIWGGTDPATGHFREACVILGDTGGGSIKQRAGFTAAWVKGDTVVVSAWSGSGGVFTTNIGTGKTLYAVTIDWDASIDAKGRHYGHLLAGAATANSNTYSYNSGTGVLTIGIGSGETTSGKIITYVSNSNSGLTLDTCDGYTLSGFNSALWCTTVAGYGYGVLGSDANNCDVSVNCFDNGWHGIGFLGQVQNGNTIHDCVVSGGVHTSASIVFFTYANSLTNATCRNVTVLKQTHLGRTGDLLNPAWSISACFSHSSVPAKVVGVKWIDVTVIEMGKISDSTGNGGAAFGTNDTAPPADPSDPNSYAVQCIRCKVVGGSGCQGFTSIAFVNCELDFSRMSAVGSPVQTIGDNATATGANSPAHYGFFGSVIKVDQSNAATIYSLFLVGNSSNSSKVWLHHCSVYSNGSVGGAGNQVMFFYQDISGGGNVEAKGTIFAFRTTNGNRWICLNDSAMAAGKHVFTDCVYWNISAGLWSQNATFNTAAEWASVIDPNGIQRVANPYATLDGSDMQPATDLKAIKKPLGLKVPFGINGLPNDGTYGAYQYGGSVGGSGGSARTSGVGIEISI